MTRLDPNQMLVPANPVAGVARHALSRLSQEMSLHYPDTPQRLLIRFVDQLQAAVCLSDPQRAAHVLDLMRRAGLLASDIADFYVPVVARRLGEDWVTDRMSFAEVSLACARLQSLLRQLDASWYCPRGGGYGMGAHVCVIVPRGEQHSLGAHVLSGQLRRAGCLVRLCVDMSRATIAALVAESRFDSIMISASRWQSLDVLRPFVKEMRRADGKVPVVIGGNILDLGIDVFERIGADYAANDWQAALSHCGQEISQ